MLSFSCIIWVRVQDTWLAFGWPDYLPVYTSSNLDDNLTIRKEICLSARLLHVSPVKIGVRAALEMDELKPSSRGLVKTCDNNSSNNRTEFVIVRTKLKARMTAGCLALSSG